MDFLFSSVQLHYAINRRKLLDMVRIYPAEGGCYTAPDGKQIVFDRELGVLLKDGER